MIKWKLYLRSLETPAKSGKWYHCKYWPVELKTLHSLVASANIFPGNTNYWANTAKSFYSLEGDGYPQRIWIRPGIYKSKLKNET